MLFKPFVLPIKLFEYILARLILYIWGDNVFVKGPYPDICIGYNKNKNDEEIVDLIEKGMKPIILVIKKTIHISGAIKLNKEYLSSRRQI